jgi:hypothetical protein
MLDRNLWLFLPILLIRLVCQPLIWLPVSLAVAGIAWTLIEYLFHRFLLHREDLLPDPATPTDLARNFIGHAVHHCFPHYSTMLVLRPFETILGQAMAGMFCLLYGLIGMSVEAVWAVILGLLAGLLAYDWIHYSIHFSNY